MSSAAPEKPGNLTSYDAITLDTNVFTKNGYKLDQGLLAQLSQFSEGSAQFVISIVVVSEIKRHMMANAEEALQALATAQRKSRNTGVLTREATKQLEDVVTGASTAEATAYAALSAYFAATKAEFIEASHGDMDDLAKRYARHLPPFEPTGAKKDEFPDAMALLSLDGWARANNKHILAISHDDGWKRFAASSAHIDVETDLSLALQHFQEFAAQARERVTAQLKVAAADPASPVLDAIREELKKAVPSMEVDADAQSSDYYELDTVELQFQDFDLWQLGKEFDFSIVRTGKDRVVANVTVTVKAKAIAEFSFQKWDSIDSEYISLGSITAVRDVEFDTSAILTFEGDLFGSGDLRLAGTEIVETTPSVDFDYIEPDFGEPDPDDDPHPDTADHRAKDF